ncbi:hypothetical protein LTR94_035497, partial [Friedmanniomyces endolithicus]
RQHLVGGSDRRRRRGARPPLAAVRRHLHLRPVADRHSYLGYGRSGAGDAHDIGADRHARAGGPHARRGPLADPATRQSGRAASLCADRARHARRGAGAGERRRG